MGLTIGAAVLVAVVGSIFKSEFEAWMPWIARMLTRLAVRVLPARMRERYREEWAAHIAELPGYLAKVLAALGFMLAAQHWRLADWSRDLLADIFSVIIYPTSRLGSWMCGPLLRRGKEEVTLYSNVEIMRFTLGRDVMMFAGYCGLAVCELRVPASDNQRQQLEEGARVLREARAKASHEAPSTVQVIKLLLKRQTS